MQVDSEALFGGTGDSGRVSKTSKTKFGSSSSSSSSSSSAASSLIEGEGLDGWKPECEEQYLPPELVKLSKEEKTCQIMYSHNQYKRTGGGESGQTRISSRRTVDYYAPIVSYLSEHTVFQDHRDWQTHSISSRNSVAGMKPSFLEVGSVAHGYCTKYVSTGVNKERCSVNCLIWALDGKRLITGNEKGQLTMWNALKLNFENLIMNPWNNNHKSDSLSSSSSSSSMMMISIRKLIWHRTDRILVSVYRNGGIVYWTDRLKIILKKSNAHDACINDVALSPTFHKMVTVSSDEYVKIWDFARVELGCENQMNDHGWDVTCVDWHNTRSLIVSGSKDKMAKLWDPRSGECLRSLRAHKNTVSCVSFNKFDDYLLATASKDHLVKLWDLRTFKVLQTLRCEVDEVSSMEWHPFYTSMLAVGGSNGTVKFFEVGKSETQAEITKAHDRVVWALSWHPCGHLLATGSADNATRFWARNKPGDTMNDRYNVTQLQGQAKDDALQALASAQQLSHPSKSSVMSHQNSESEVINTAGEDRDDFFSTGFQQPMMAPRITHPPMNPASSMVHPHHHAHAHHHPSHAPMTGMYGVYGAHPPPVYGLAPAMPGYPPTSHPGAYPPSAAAVPPPHTHPALSHPHPPGAVPMPGYVPHPPQPPSQSTDPRTRYDPRLRR